MSLGRQATRQRRSREIAEISPPGQKLGSETAYRSFPMAEPKVEFQKPPKKPPGWDRHEPLTPEERQSAIEAFQAIRLPDVSNR